MKYTLGISVVRFSLVHIAQISSLCEFHYISEGIRSLMRFWLLMTSVLRIWFMQIFTRPKKRTIQGLGVQHHVYFQAEN